ncbi:LysR family transcriptional regulator [Pseudomonas fluorescens]|uniref:LysR family transcriptional regulator n=1 Tax=Pseudomonas fluorescens TaxID=294 RepID=A0A944HBB7_PSEFL|nr:LysR family transcriptional regulator [Pseudomonas fluorescens]MBT2298035.1 LysR family transcriptional regulator [Pseudomonas fluorescens]MBT2309842.1 LysR family transcriptional regulator [Pseudomonas fluorescens]MBT2315005.1 LysR family transcriptional regulator [Pseudomonas fluorescens]MBT2327911.1 LysR family transcriptional regulator [Pseudomonas fluorescens]MBT2345658.1 LysR family transcriptional regulator [Pseudomonas fluorescens]
MDVSNTSLTATPLIDFPVDSTQFDWENLRYFITFARIRSLAAAARSLNVEHATVSRRIAALETALKIRLVDRRSHRYELTENGERIAQLGNRMQETACALSRAVCAIRTDKVADITLSAPPHLTTHFIAPHLGRLRGQCPDVNVRILSNPRMASMARREADIAISVGRPTETDLVVRKIGTLDFGFFAAEAYLQDRAASAYEFIAHDDEQEPSAQRIWLENAAGQRPVVLRVKSFDVQAEAARAGAGIALLPVFMASAQSGLQRVPIEEQPLHAELWLVVHRDMRTAPGIRAMMDFVIHCFAQQHR